MKDAPYKRIAKEFKVKESKFRYQRIKIKTKDPKGKKGPLLIETSFLFSVGVNEKKNQESDKLVGYSVPVLLLVGKRFRSKSKGKSIF